MISAIRTSQMRHASAAYLLTAIVLPFAQSVRATTTIPPYQTLGPFAAAGQQEASSPDLPDPVRSGGDMITRDLSEPLPDSSDESMFFWSIRNPRIEAVQLMGVGIQEPASPGVSAEERQMDTRNGPGDPRPLAEALQPNLADPGDWVVITSQPRQQLLADLWYLNVRSSNVEVDPEPEYPSWLEGELQGQLPASIYVIPVPSTLALGCVGFVLVHDLRRRVSLS